MIQSLASKNLIQIPITTFDKIVKESDTIYQIRTVTKNRTCQLGRGREPQARSFRAHPSSAENGNLGIGKRKHTTRQTSTSSPFHSPLPISQIQASPCGKSSAPSKAPYSPMSPFLSLDYSQRSPRRDEASFKPHHSTKTRTSAFSGWTRAWFFALACQTKAFLSSNCSSWLEPLSSSRVVTEAQKAAYGVFPRSTNHINLLSNRPPAFS